MINNELDKYFCYFYVEVCIKDGVFYLRLFLFGICNVIERYFNNFLFNWGIFILKGVEF